jgi:arylsulfatase A-like enzyme
MPDPLNLLLIVVDQWRGDALGALGHPVAQTPHLDVLARGGWTFTRAYSSCPSCIAARAGLMTGLGQRRHGFVGYRDGVPWRYGTTLAGTLAAAGYHTQAVGKMHVYPERNLLGFHNVVLHDGYLHFARSRNPDFGRIDDYLPWLRERLGTPYADYVDTGVGCNGYVARPWVYDEMLHPSSWVTTQSIDFLRRRDPGRPFFLMASYHRPHPPLDPPAAFLEQFRDVELPPLPLGDWVDHELDTHRGADSPVPGDPRQIDLARRAYYAQLKHLDYQVNRLTMALHEHGLAGNTAVVFVADHGELLYDHRLVAKGLPYEGSARVPLLLKLPGAAPAVVEAPVELRDLFPTLCDAAGVPIPAGLDGASLLPLARGQATSWRPWLHGEHTAGAWSNHWLCDGASKYVWFSQTGRQQLFDLASDPSECHDLSTARPEELALWRGRLVGELAEAPEGFVQEGRLVAGRAVAATLEWAGVGC